MENQKNTEITKTTELLTEELAAAGFDREDAAEAAELMAENGWRRQRLGEWVKDETYTGTFKEIYVCSVCNHWQSAKKRSDKVFYMNYCPFCGAKMTGKPRKEP